MGELINVQASTANIANLLFDLDPSTQEKFMRDFVSPVHYKHAFSIIIKQLGHQRPEVALLAEFVELTRRTYSYAKLLKLRVINKDGLFTVDNLKKKC